MTSKTSFRSRATVVFAVLSFAALVACGKKGMPEECDQYLARYECWLGKTGMAPSAAQSTVSGMRSTWTEASKNSVGRNAVLDACKKSQGEMESKFTEKGCQSAAPAKK